MSHTKKRWSSAEVNRLVLMWEEKVSLPDMANVLGRREVVIRAKVSRLRLESSRLKKRLKLRCERKLTEADIPKIRTDRRSLRAIGADYGVDPVTIWKVKKRETWRHVG